MAMPPLSSTNPSRNTTLANISLSTCEAESSLQSLPRTSSESFSPWRSAFNIGYHLVYYGDQALEDGYYDRGGQRCEGTPRSIFRRLKSERYRVGWALDLLTLQQSLREKRYDWPRVRSSDRAKKLA